MLSIRLLESRRLRMCSSYSRAPFQSIPCYTGLICGHRWLSYQHGFKRYPPDDLPSNTLFGAKYGTFSVSSFSKLSAFFRLHCTRRTTTGTVRSCISPQPKKLSMDRSAGSNRSKWGKTKPEKKRKKANQRNIT